MSSTVFTCVIVIRAWAYTRVVRKNGKYSNEGPLSFRTHVHVYTYTCVAALLYEIVTYAYEATNVVSFVPTYHDYTRVALHRYTTPGKLLYPPFVRFRFRFLFRVCHLLSRAVCNVSGNSLSHLEKISYIRFDK